MEVQFVQIHECGYCVVHGASVLAYCGEIMMHSCTCACTQHVLEVYFVLFKCMHSNFINMNMCNAHV